MAVAYSRYVDGTSSSGSRTAVVDLSACSAGDLVFVLVSRAAVVEPSSYPSGWSSANLIQSHLSTYGIWLFAKVLAAGENVSTTFTWAASAKTLAHALVYTGAKVKSSAKGTYATASGTTVACGSITSSETWLAQFCSGYSTATRSYAALSGYTERRDRGGTAPDFWHVLADTNGSWAGGVCAPVFSYDSGNTCTYRGGFIVELEAATFLYATSTFKLKVPKLAGTATNSPPARSADAAFKLQSPVLTSTATNVPPAREGNGGLAAQLPLIGGAATNAPPSSDRTATGGLRAQLPLLGGTAANVPPARSAAGGLAVQLPLLGGTAANVPPARAGSGGLAAQLPLFSGAAANVPPARTASGALRLQLPSLSGAATSAEVRSAGGGLGLKLPSLGGTATVERLASGGLALSLPSLSVTATNTPPARTAAGGLSVPRPSLDGVAVVAMAEPGTAGGGLALSAPVISSTATRTYRALYFDGANDVVHLGALGVTSGSLFTLETICRPVPVSGTRYALGESGDVARVGLGVSDGAAYVRLVSDTGVLVELAGATLTDGELHYLALTADTLRARLYVDGVLEDTKALPAGGFTITTTTLGALGAAGYWYGEVASARLYRKCFDAPWIVSHHDAWLEWSTYLETKAVVAVVVYGPRWRGVVAQRSWAADPLPSRWRAIPVGSRWDAECDAGWAGILRKDGEG